MIRSVLGYQRTVMMRVRPLLILLVSHLAVRGDTNVSENSRLQAAVALERMYAKVSELEKRVVAQAAEIEQLKPMARAVVPYQPNQRRRTEASDCTLFPVEGTKDPHLSFARGGRADFRGHNGRACRV